MSRKDSQDILQVWLAGPQRLQDKFRTSDQILESIVQNANVWINVLDPQKNVLLWNKAAEMMSGYSAQEVIGHGKVWEWLYPDENYRKQITDQVEILMKRGNAEIDVETRITRKDGRVRTISWNERSLLEQNGRATGSIAVGRDITTRKQLEEQLQESEKKYRAIVENSPNLIGVFQDGALKYVNSVAIHNLGWSLEELTAPSFNPIEKAVSKKSQNALRENIRKRLRGENVAAYEIILTRKDGSEVPVEVRGAKIMYDRRPAIQFSFTDIAERKLAEEELNKSQEAIRVSEKRLREAMEATNDGLWEWNIETGEMYFSPAWNRIIGYEPGEIRDNIQAWKDLIHPEDLDRTIRANEDCINNRTSNFEVEYRLKTKSGQWKWILGRGSATTRATNGRALRMVGTHVDVSERKKLEERLRSLHEHALGLASATTMDEIVKGTLDTIQFTLGFDCADFNLVEDGRVTVKGKRGWDIGAFSVDLHEPSVVAKAARTMKSVRVGDIRTEHDYLDRMGRDWRGPPTMLSELATPVIIDNQTVAVLNIEKADANAFSELDQNLLETLASHVASTLKRERLERELKKYSENLEATVKERTRELQLTKERLEYVIESNPAVVYTAKPFPDFSGYHATFMSKNIASMVGFGAQKFIGAEGAAFWTSRVHPDDLASYKSELSKLWKEGHLTCEYRFLHKNESYHWIREEATVIRDSTGSVLDVIGLWTDVTERKQAQEAEERRSAEVAMQLFDITDRLESLARTREKLKTVPDVVTGLEVILESVLWDFNLDRGAVLVLDKQEKRMNVRASKARAKEINLNQSYPLEGLAELKDLQVKSITRIVGENEKSILGTPVVHIIPILEGTEIYGVMAFGNEDQKSLQESNVRILELYSELVHSFVTEKSVALTPVLESKTTREASHLELGQIYLFKKEPAKAFEVFASTVFGGHEGLCITRMYPPKVRDKYGLEKTPIVWLTSEALEGENSVHSIQDLSIMIGDYLDKAEKAVVLIDGFEYLITNHGFEAFLKFLQILRDRMQKRNGVLIAPVLEQALDPKELGLIERETQVVTEPS